jgi:hypothetical protein
MSWEAVKDTVNWAGQIIAAGRPSANLPTQMANAVPDVSDWTSLTDARGPQTTDWTAIHYVNGFGLEVVKVRLRLNWNYGARYRNGGAFITNCWVEVPQCDVLWGYSVDLGFQAQQPENAASSGSPPHARIPLTIRGTVSTPFWTTNVGWGFTVYGDGHSEVRNP